jgi:hypothetical protein
MRKTVVNTYMTKQKIQNLPNTVDVLLLNSRASAVMLGISLGSFRRWVKNGIINPINLQTKRNQLFKKTDLESLVERNTPATKETE